MSNSGGTIGIPITGGVGTGLNVAEPLPITHLSLARYANIMGIAPAHFFGSYSTSAFPVQLGGTRCEMVWPRHSWQDLGRTSREEMAHHIREAEILISEFLGFNVAPTYVVNEVHPYPKEYSNDGYSTTLGLDSRGRMKRIILSRGSKLIQAGARSVTKVGTATTGGGSLAYTDEDGDGFIETATVTMATSELSVCSLKAFVTDVGGAPEWEIRPAKKKSISGGVLTMVFNSWMLIDPDIDASFPTEEQYRAIDITTTANFLDSVDIYKEYIDNTLVSARFFWERAGICANCNGAGCDACSLAYQDGCAIVGDVGLGVLVPKPAEYDSVNGLWNSVPFSYGRDPDQVRVSYYAGDISQSYLNGVSCDPLKTLYANAIAWLATARTTKPVCSCPQLADNFEYLRTDLAQFGGDVSFVTTEAMLNNPFGTRRGEVMAWNAIARINRDIAVEVAVV